MFNIVFILYAFIEDAVLDCSEKALALTNNSGVAAATEWWVEIYCHEILFTFGVNWTKCVRTISVDLCWQLSSEFSYVTNWSSVNAVNTKYFSAQ